MNGIMKLVELQIPVRTKYADIFQEEMIYKILDKSMRKVCRIN